MISDKSDDNIVTGHHKIKVLTSKKFSAEYFADNAGASGEVISSAVSRIQVRRLLGSRACKEKRKQAGTELGQAQLKLELDLTLFFCIFGFSRLGLVDLVGWI